MGIVFEWAWELKWEPYSPTGWEWVWLVITGSQIIPVYLLNPRLLWLLSCRVRGSKNARKLWLPENIFSSHSSRSDIISRSTLPVLMYGDFRNRLFWKQPRMRMGMGRNGNGGMWKWEWEWSAVIGNDEMTWWEWDGLGTVQVIPAHL